MCTTLQLQRQLLCRVPPSGQARRGKRRRWVARRGAYSVQERISLVLYLRLYAIADYENEISSGSMGCASEPSDMPLATLALLRARTLRDCAWPTLLPASAAQHGGWLRRIEASLACMDTPAHA